MPEEIKRLHYYDQQFLREPDFTAEQEYHREMRHRHNRNLHTWGIVDGLLISKTDDQKITVSPGMAIDRDGKEIVLLAPKELPITEAGNAQKYVTIRYTEELTDPPRPEDRISEADRTRVTESAFVEIADTPPTPADQGLIIILGRVIFEAGKIKAIDDGLAPNQRRYSGATGQGYFSRVGIGTTGPEAKLTIDDPTGDTTWNTAAFRKAALGPHWSHIHFGPRGDWYIRSAASDGKVIIQDSGGNVGIGTTTPDFRLDLNADIGKEQDVVRFGHLPGITNGFMIHKYANDTYAYLFGNGNVAVEGTTKTKVLTVEDKIGIGTSNPRASLSVMKKVADLVTGIEFSSHHTPDVVAGGLINAHDENGTVRHLSLQTDGGNVGIGTTKPQSKLHVEGIIKLGAQDEDWSGIQNTDRAIHFYSKGAHTDLPNKVHTGGRIYSTSTGAGWERQALVLETAKDFKEGKEFWVPNQLVLKGDGNVGIGTPEPKSKLHVFDNTGTGDGVLIQAGYPFGAGIYPSILTLKDKDNAYELFDLNSDGSFYFNRGPDRVLTGAANGNVGIWTTDPKERLQIGDRMAFHDGGWKGIFFNWYATDQWRRINDGFSGAFAFDTGNGELRFLTGPNGPKNTNPELAIRMAIQNDGKVNFQGDGYFAGNVGVGTTQPGRKLVVDGNSSIYSEPRLWGEGLRIIGKGSGTHAATFYGRDDADGKALWFTGIGVFPKDDKNKEKEFESDLIFLSGPGRDGGLDSAQFGSSSLAKDYRGDAVMVLQHSTGNALFGAAIIPSAGNSESSGILFPKDPGGGGGDSAWIRYYPRSGEATTFEIGTSNDADDHIALMTSGGVGIGVTDPSAKLDVNGQIRIRGGEPGDRKILTCDTNGNATWRYPASPVTLSHAQLESTSVDGFSTYAAFVVDFSNLPKKELQFTGQHTASIPNPNAGKVRIRIDDSIIWTSLAPLGWNTFDSGIKSHGFDSGLHLIELQVSGNKTGTITFAGFAKSSVVVLQ